MVPCVSEYTAYIQTAAVMLRPCGVIAPTVANGDESANRLQPADADNYHSLVVTVSTHKHSDGCVSLITHTL